MTSFINQTSTSQPIYRGGTPRQQVGQNQTGQLTVGDKVALQSGQQLSITRPDGRTYFLDKAAMERVGQQFGHQLFITKVDGEKGDRVSLSAEGGPHTWQLEDSGRTSFRIEDANGNNVTDSILAMVQPSQATPTTHPPLPPSPPEESQPPAPLDQTPPPPPPAPAPSSGQGSTSGSLTQQEDAWIDQFTQ